MATERALVELVPERTARVASPRRRRERRTLAVTAVLAIAAPIGSAAWVGARTDALAARIAAVAGVPVRIGGVDARLTGTVRLSDVALGDLVTADAIEGSVGMSSLLDAELRADEIRVEHPAVAVRVDHDGDSDLARVARRIATRARDARGASPARRAPVRRIVVDGGRLTARIAGLGELSADAVELVPDRDGARIITGPVELRAATTAPGGVPAALAIVFARSAAELRIPEARFGRVLAVGGAGALAVGDQRLAVAHVAAGRHRATGALEVRGELADAGGARPIGADVRPDAITVFGDGVPLRALAALAPPGLSLAGTHTPATATLRRAPRAPDATELATELSFDAEVDGVVVDHPALAPRPVPVAATVRADLAITRDAIAMPRGALRLGAVELVASGWARRGAPTSGQLEVQLAPTPCRELLAALPEPLRGPLDGLVLAGTLGARARLAIDLAAPAGEGAALTHTLIGGCRALAEPPAADVTTLGGVVEQQLADGTRARVGRGEPGWAALAALPAHVPGAFVSAEDGRFYDHDGFDPYQIARSLEIDLRERRFARGGSTISQQLVKNAFLSQRRSFDRKLQEAVLTWRLEERLDKRQILERYLNVIELGPRVWGIGAAARYWFDVAPEDLTVRQAAFLAALTAQPASMSRRIRGAGGVDPASAERVAAILRAMRRDGVIDEDAYREARAAKLALRRAALRD